MSDWPPEDRVDEHGTPYWGRVVDGRWETNPDIINMFAAAQQAFAGMVERLRTATSRDSDTAGDTR